MDRKLHRERQPHLIRVVVVGTAGESLPVHPRVGRGRHRDELVDRQRKLPVEGPQVPRHQLPPVPRLLLGLGLGSGQRLLQRRLLNVERSRAGLQCRIVASLQLVHNGNGFNKPRLGSSLLRLLTYNLAGSFGSRAQGDFIKRAWRNLANRLLHGRTGFSRPDDEGVCGSELGLAGKLGDHTGAVQEAALLSPDLRAGLVQLGEQLHLPLCCRELTLQLVDGQLQFDNLLILLTKRICSILLQLGD